MKPLALFGTIAALLAATAVPVMTATAAKPKKPTVKKPWKYSGKTSQGKRMSIRWTGEAVLLKGSITGPCTDNGTPVTVSYTLDGSADLAKAGKFSEDELAGRKPMVADDESAVATTSGKLTSKKVTGKIRIKAEGEGSAPCGASSATFKLKRK
ncbi:MAG TPA: hypothetical protein VEX36_00195 [Thermoleophilaceae bacterium]|nr:hypothetical protein [Thermoleophilaceae bacterium]